MISNECVFFFIDFVKDLIASERIKQPEMRSQEKLRRSHYITFEFHL